MYRNVFRLALLLALGALPACQIDRARTSDAAAQPEPHAEVEAARAATALAAVLEAAAQVADSDSLPLLRDFGIVQPSQAWAREMFPERLALARAVDAWPEARKRAALEWVLPNATWTTLLNAMVLESFGTAFEPLEWGPSMSGFNPTIFGNRVSLAPLLEEALQDEALLRIAETISVQKEPFTPSGIQERRAKLVAYLRFSDELPAFSAFFNSLLFPENGVNAQLPDGSVMMVVGPSPDVGARSMVLFHEMAHQPVDRILGLPEVAAAVEASRCAFKAIEERSGYDEWEWFFGEALVRSLSYRLEGVAARNTGLVFEEYLTDALERWESTPDVAFSDAVVAMLSGIREAHCEGAGVPKPTCPEPFLALESGTCAAFPAADEAPAPAVLVYLHGMVSNPSFARSEAARLATEATKAGWTLLAPLGSQGACNWSEEVKGWWCWPNQPGQQTGLDALVGRLEADLLEVGRMLAVDDLPAPVLAGFSNGGYGAAQIVAATKMSLGGLVVLHGGGNSPVSRDRAVPTLLRAAKGDEWHHPTMVSFREMLAAAGWKPEWQEREGAHALSDSDIAAIVEFLTRLP